MDPDLSPEIRATLLISAMTLDQKIQQLANKPAPNFISGTYLSENGQTPCLPPSLGRHLDGIPELGIPFNVKNTGWWPVPRRHRST